jgi:hypothetical protein
VDRRDGGFVLRAAFAANTELQSRSVFGSRADSAGVRGEGDAGRDADAEFVVDECELPGRLSCDMSDPKRGDGIGEGPLFELAGDTPRDDT